MQKGIIRFGLLTAVCLLCAWGCAGREPREAQEETVIGIVTKSRNSEYWMSVCSGMEKAAQERGAEVVILSPDSETDKKVQKRMIYDLLKMGVDALAVSPIDSYDNEDYCQAAEEEGVSVYSYDTPVSDVDVPYIGIDNEKVGYELAKVLAEKLEHRGNIAVIAGSTAQASHQARIDGFERYMKSEPDIQIEMVKSGYSNLRVSEQEMEEIREDYPDLDGIMTTSAVTALGIAEATSGTEIAIASFDVQEDAIRAVENGSITALAAQSGYDIGYAAVNYIMDDREGVKQEKEKILEARILTKENVGEY